MLTQMYQLLNEERCTTLNISMLNYNEIKMYLFRHEFDKSLKEIL